MSSSEGGEPVREGKVERDKGKSDGSWWRSLWQSWWPSEETGKERVLHRRQSFFPRRPSIVPLPSSPSSSSSNAVSSHRADAHAHHDPHSSHQYSDHDLQKITPNPSQLAEYGFRMAEHQDALLHDNEEVDHFASLTRGAWAGAVAGIIADTLMHPFDTVSTRLKVQQSVPGQIPKYHGLLGTTRVMIQEEGVRSLFSGVSATVLCALPSSAVYFGVYETVKSVGLRYARESHNSSDEAQVPMAYKADAVHLTAGICSELASSFIVVPFEVIKSRLQVGSTAYSGTLNGLYSIARQEGLAGLFAGYRACLLLDCSLSGVQFLLYERLRKDLKSHREVPKPSIETPLDDSMQELMDSVEDTAEDLLAGAVSGGLAAFICNPFDVAVARLMVQSAPRGPHAKALPMYKGTIDCLVTVAKSEGLRGLWSGALARVLSIAPLSALTFGIYEKMKSFLHQSDLSNK